MTIQYLTLMQEHPRLGGITNQGVSKEAIEAYERKHNISFPKAYKEYLFLGGVRSRVLGGINGGGFPEYKTRQQLYTKKLLKEEGLQIAGGDFWVTTDIHGGEQFDFFYFNDPTAEDPENPPVYNSYPGILDEDYPLKKKIANSFSEWIEKKIKNYLPRDN